MNPKIVDMREGWNWFLEGIRIFSLNPKMWVIATFTWALTAYTLLIIPFLGNILTWVTMPAIYAGFFVWASKLDKNQEINFTQLFTGFADSEARQKLLVVGVISVSAIIVVSVMSAPANAGMSGEGISPAMMINIFLRILIMVMVSVLLSCAYIYAAPLILYKNEDAFDAMMTSIDVCYKNWRAFLYFAGFYVVLIALLGPISIGYLAVVLVVIWPISVGAAYASYKSIYGKDAPTS